MRPLIAAFVFLLTPVALSQQPGTFLVPQYPGAVAEEYPSDVGHEREVPLPSRMQVFYTKDAPERVHAFYQQTVPAFVELDDATGGKYGAMVPAEVVHKFLVDHNLIRGEASYDFTRGTRAGISLYGKPPTYNVNVHTVIDRLRSAYLLRFNGVEGEDPTTMSRHLEDPEFKKVLANYEHLEWEHYMTVKGRKMDEVIVQKHYGDPEKKANDDAASLTKKMQDLMTAGKYDEATKVGEELTNLAMRPTDPAYNWEVATACLDELSVHAYPTKLILDRPLVEWDLSTIPPEK